jgi:hypothetical protein
MNNDEYTARRSAEVKIGDVVRVKRKGWGAIACVFLGHPVESPEVFYPDDTDEPADRHEACGNGFWDVEEYEDTDRAVVVMVGDDHKHIVDTDELEPIPEESYCHVCGQMGCTHDGLDRSIENDN